MTEVEGYKLNLRAQAVRDRMAKEAQEYYEGDERPREAVLDSSKQPKRQCSIEKMMVVLKILRDKGSRTRKELMNELNAASSGIWNATNELEKMGAIVAIHEDPTEYAYKETPEGWDLDSVEIKVRPMVRKPVDSTPADNPLTDILAKKDIRIKMDAIEAYEQFIKDTSKHYIKELDDLLAVVHRVCMDRINSATAKCPVCGKKLGRKGSSVFCNSPGCNLTIDTGDSFRSLEVFLEYAVKIKEVE